MARTLKKPTASAVPPIDDDTRLRAQLDKLALLVTERAIDPSPDEAEQLPMQINALKVVGGYWALSRKWTPPKGKEGSGWGAVTGAIFNGHDDEGDGDAETEGA